MAARCIRSLRSRALDLFLVGGGVVLLSTPFLAWAMAAPPVAEKAMTVDQQVASSALISLPLAADFQAPDSGREVGSVRWDVYTSAKQGYKLAVSADSTPSLRGDGCAMPDVQADPKPWSIGPGQWGFGVSATGDQTLAAYRDSGDRQWRGLDGRRPIEVARHRGGATRATRTTVWMAAENNSSTSCANAKVDILGTVFVNL
jgi:hypothetical protein